MHVNTSRLIHEVDFYMSIYGMCVCGPMCCMFLEVTCQVGMTVYSYCAVSHQAGNGFQELTESRLCMYDMGQE